MIAEHTKLAIIALLAVDKTATDEERQTVARALAGTPPGPVVLSIKEVCRRLGKTRQTVYNLCKRGLLQSVKGAGNKGLNSGITAASLSAYLREGAV